MIFFSGDAKNLECPFRVMALMSTARGQQGCKGHWCPMWQFADPDDYKPHDERRGFCGLIKDLRKLLSGE